MAAIEGARVPSLQATITPRIIRCFAITAETFDVGDAVAGSPSLRTLRALLRERVGGESWLRNDMTLDTSDGSWV